MIKQAVDAIIAALAAGRWVVVIIAIIYFILASPFGILFNEETDECPSIQQVIIDINSDFNSNLGRIIESNDEANKVVFNTDNDSMYYTPPNWIDVLNIFAVKNTTATSNDYLDVLVMEDKQIQALKDVFWDMKNITHRIGEIEDEEGEIQIVLFIDIESLSHSQGANLYHFTAEQREYLNESLSTEYYPIFMELCGMDSFVGLTPEQAIVLINSLSNNTGENVVRNAISRLRTPIFTITTRTRQLCRLFLLYKVVLQPSRD